MVDQRWPRGIDPHGNGLRIRIKHKNLPDRYKKNGWSKVIPGNPLNPAHVAAAVRERDRLKSRLNLGLSITESTSSNALFGEAAQSFLDTLDVERSTAMSYASILNQYWIPNFGTWLVTEIKPSDIKKMLAKAKVSQKTKQNILGAGRGVFTHAIDDGVDMNNPAEAVKLKKHQKPAIERFLPAERDKILGQLSGQALVYFTLFFATGARPGELLGLTWKDWDGEYLDIHQSIVRRRLKRSTKNHEQRRVYVPQWARGVLNNHATRFKAGFVFLNSFGRHHLDPDRFNEAWWAALEKAKVRYRIPYTCRHTRAAELLSTGHDPAACAKQLGHSLEIFLRTYSEWIEEYSKGRVFEGVEVKTDLVSQKCPRV